MGLATNQLLKGFDHSEEFEDYPKELEQEAGLYCQKIACESQVENELVWCRPGEPPVQWVKSNRPFAVDFEV